MEDIKQYIESGILELFALGDLSFEEKAEVERMASLHPQVKTELDEISRSLQSYAFENEIQPAEKLRDNIFEKLQFSDVDLDAIIASDAIIENNPDYEAKIVPLKRVQFYKYGFAASVLLFLISLIALLNTNKNLQYYKRQVASLQTQDQTLASTANYQGKYLQSQQRIIALENLNAGYKNQLSLFTDPASDIIKLKGTAHSPSSNLLVAWNSVQNKLYINKKFADLPKTDASHQYQLWAITKSKETISLGVFDINNRDSILQKMTSVKSAAAFAVTLEPRGGSAKPTMDQMMVMGTVE